MIKSKMKDLEKENRFIKDVHQTRKNNHIHICTYLQIIQQQQKIPWMYSMIHNRDENMLQICMI